MKRISHITLMLLALLLVPACTTLEIGIEQPIASTPHVTVTLPVAAEAPSSAPIVTPRPIVLSTSTATIAPTVTQRPVVRPTATAIAPSPTPTLSPEVPTILNFSVEPREVNPGETVIVHWSTANGAAAIHQRGADDYPYTETEVIAPEGEHPQTILGRERLWHTFQLIVSRAALSSTQTITVSIRCPDTYFFSPLPAADRETWSCPDGPAVTSPAAEQIFENGRMVWTQTDKRIYVLLNDGTYRTYDDTWTAHEPDRDPTITPPEGRYQPVRGFGKVWRTQPGVRAQLGWAVAVEQSFETQLQGGWIHCCSRLGAVNRPIYLRNAESRIIRLWPGEFPLGQWSFIAP